MTASALPADGESRVLLARRGIDPHRGLWDVVGGFVEEGEHPRDALLREVEEETGLGFEPERLLGIWMGRYAVDDRATLNLFWTGRLSAGEPTAADDVAELQWFAADGLPPPNELAFDGLIGEVLAAWLRDQHA